MGDCQPRPLINWTNWHCLGKKKKVLEECKRWRRKVPKMLPGRFTSKKTQICCETKMLQEFLPSQWSSSSKQFIYIKGIFQSLCLCKVYFRFPSNRILLNLQTFCSNSDWNLTHKPAKYSGLILLYSGGKVPYSRGRTKARQPFLEVCAQKK